MLSVAPHTSVLVIASKIIVRRRISVLPTYLKNLISSKNISSSQFFSNFFLKKVTFTNFCKKYVRLNFHTMNITVWKNEKFSFTDKKFHLINYLFSNYFSKIKTIAFTKFLPKLRESKFLVFPTVVWK